MAFLSFYGAEQCIKAREGRRVTLCSYDTGTGLNCFVEGIGRDKTSPGFPDEGMERMFVP